MFSVIFDIDGVLVDSEELMASVAVAVMKRYGADIDPAEYRIHAGGSEAEYFGIPAESHGVSYSESIGAEIYAAYEECAPTLLKPIPGMPELLDFFASRQIRMAVASSAASHKVAANLSVYGERTSLFDVIVTGDEAAAHKKPEPDLFLIAADKLGEAPCNCVVIEDSLNGIIAAKRAGMVAVGLTTSFDAERLRSVGADYVFFEALAMKDLVDILV